MRLWTWLVLRWWDLWTEYAIYSNRVSMKTFDRWLEKYQAAITRHWVA